MKRDNHGGKRKGAGRPRRYEFGECLAIANAVTLIQREHGVSRSKALSMLEEQKVITLGYATASRRYLTPKYLEPEIYRILREHDRAGILTLINMPKPFKRKT